MGYTLFMETREELYTEEEILALERKLRAGRISLALFAAAALTACVVLCCLTGPENAARMEGTVIAISTLAGWFVLYRLRFGLRERKLEIGHARMLRAGPGERMEGRPELTGAEMRIRGSIRFCPVVLRGEGGEHRLRVIASKADALRREDIEAVYVVNGFIAGIGARR